VRAPRSTYLLRLIHIYRAVLLSCRVAKGLDVSFLIWLHSAAVFDSHIPCSARAMPRSCHSERDFSRSRHSAAWAWLDVWISIGCPKTACGRPPRVRLLPATIRIYTKVIRSIPVRYTVGLAVWIFPATTRTCPKDTALSENGRGAAWHVWIIHGCTV
jgi:hypothetical protein